MNTMMNQQMKDCAACKRNGSQCGFCVEQAKGIENGEYKPLRDEEDSASQASTVRSTSGKPKANPLISTIACLYCRKSGHVIAQCPELKCSYCSRQGHRKQQCPEFNEAWSWVRWAQDIKRNGGWLSKNQFARVTQYKKDLGLLK
jgi:hypothetical protein